MTGRARGGRPGVALDEVDRLFVDGNNLLHRRGGTPMGAASRLLLASMRAAMPTTLDVVLMLDGQPDPGAPHREVVRRGLEVRYAGRVDADSVLVELVAARPFAERARTLVVTDDRGLVERVRRAGGRTERLDWFEALLRAAAQSGPLPGPSGARRPASVSQGRPPAGRVGSSRGGPRGASGHPGVDGAVAPAPMPADDADAEDREPWRPGRGATKKRGNPKRGRPS